MANNAIAIGAAGTNVANSCDATGTPQFALIAEEVAEAKPDGGARRERRDLHAALCRRNAMLLNESLKEHKKVEEQQAAVAELKSTVAQQQESFATNERNQAIAAGLQNVSAQIKVRKSTPTVTPSPTPTATATATATATTTPTPTATFTPTPTATQPSPSAKPDGNSYGDVYAYPNGHTEGYPHAEGASDPGTASAFSAIETLVKDMAITASYS